MPPVDQDLSETIQACPGALKGKSAIHHDVPPPSSPLLTTLRGLTLLARIRGDGDEVALLERAAALVHSRGLETDRELGPLVEETGDDPVLTRLRHLLDAGGWVILESAIADLPADLRCLCEAEILTLDQLADLHLSTNATSLTDLTDLVRRGHVRGLPGFTVALEAAMARGLPTLRGTRRRIPLGRGFSIAEAVLQPLREHSAVAWADMAGSLRRAQETVGDIELVVATDHPEDVFSSLSAHIDVSRCLHKSRRRLYFLSDGAQVGVRCPAPAVAGATLLMLTGSHAHLDRLHARARRKGWDLSPDGLLLESGQLIAGAREADVYEALELQWVPPEIRDGAGELRAAETGTLPGLLQQRAIRGDLHMHTLYSDGRDTVDEMVRSCMALGYEYMAITDHSHRSAASVSLTVATVGQQADEIAALRERYPQIAILHGCEVDIMPDGRLDFNDRILERFDIVLASLHNRAGHGAMELLHRYELAMRHPLVSIVTHPSNRVVPGRPGYDLDYDRLFAAAVETGTMVEIDGAPSHLDLDGVLARRAVAAGAMLVVDSDSHRAEALGRQMELGVRTARRGWVEARHVMNTRPLGELQAIIAGKRTP